MSQFFFDRGVTACFAPFVIGRRGFGSPFTHQTWGLSVTDYLNKEANDQIIVCVQIENKDAVENLEEIAKIPGVGRWPDRRATFFT